MRTHPGLRNKADTGEEINSAITSQAEDSAGRAKKAIKGDYFRNSPIKSGEKTLEA